YLCRRAGDRRALRNRSSNSPGPARPAANALGWGNRLGGFGVLWAGTVAAAWRAALSWPDADRRNLLATRAGTARRTRDTRPLAAGFRRRNSNLSGRSLNGGHLCDRNDGRLSSDRGACGLAGPALLTRPRFLAGTFSAGHGRQECRGRLA